MNKKIELVINDITDIRQYLFKVIKNTDKLEYINTLLSKAEYQLSFVDDEEVK